MSKGKYVQCCVQKTQDSTEGMCSVFSVLKNPTQSSKKSLIVDGGYYLNPNYQVVKRSEK